ncbi:hypothetical protein MMC06_000607 [Schaereria dolodes]|nr:hypothetical protein [Schaereria dolodes]
MALTANDSSVILRIFDPEKAPGATVILDPSFPVDPHITDLDTLGLIKDKEAQIIKRIEIAIKDEVDQPIRSSILEKAFADLSDLIATYPNYASLRNNRAQLTRVQFGDLALISSNCLQSASLESNRGSSTLEDLHAAIILLSPATPLTPLSPAACRVLAQAYTQRGALYRAMAKLRMLSSKDETFQPILSTSIIPLQDWKVRELEEAASRDFFMGGRYGNEIGKVLAVHINPTAKLCGQMVQEAMRKEYVLVTTDAV